MFMFLLQTQILLWLSSSCRRPSSSLRQRLWFPSHALPQSSEQHQRAPEDSADHTLKTTVTRSSSRGVSDAPRGAPRSSSSSSIPECSRGLSMTLRFAARVLRARLQAPVKGNSPPALHFIHRCFLGAQPGEQGRGTMGAKKAGRPLPPRLRGPTRLLRYLKPNKAGAETAGGRNGFKFLQLQSWRPFLGTHGVLFKQTVQVLKQGR